MISRGPLMPPSTWPVQLAYWGGILILILIILMNFRDNTHEPVPKEDAEDSVRHPVSAIFASSEFGSQIIERHV